MGSGHNHGYRGVKCPHGFSLSSLVVDADPTGPNLECTSTLNSQLSILGSNDKIDPFVSLAGSFTEPNRTLVLRRDMRHVRTEDRRHFKSTTHSQMMKHMEGANLLPCFFVSCWHWNVVTSPHLTSPLHQERT